MTHDILDFSKAMCNAMRPLPYQPMAATELADLSREAGRPLTETEAMVYLKRRVIRESNERLLREDKPEQELQNRSGVNECGGDDGL